MNLMWKCIIYDTLYFSCFESVSSNQEAEYVP